jgi:hypothetical protein
VGRKRGAKLRAEVHEPDLRRCRAGRAGNGPRSCSGQGSGGVNPAAVRGRIAFLAGEISPCARKGDGDDPAREVSRGRSSRETKGRRNGRGGPLVLGFGLSQMFASAKLANQPGWVKPEWFWQRETESGGSATRHPRRRAGTHSCALTSTVPTARCGPACRVVWEGSDQR